MSRLLLSKRLVSLVALGFLLMPANSFGQVFTANLTGVVTDPNKGVIPAVVVKLRNVGTNETRQTTTTGEGRYTFSQLLPGSYDVTAEARGFKSATHRAIVLVANQSGEANFSLQVGDVAQSVDVVGDVSAVDTQTANQAITLESKALQELPLNMRNAFAYVNAVAGTVAIRTGIPTSVGDSGWGRFALNGGRDESAAMLVDGVSPTTGDWGFIQAAPGNDSIVEVQVVRNSYDAQYGKSGGGVVNVVTKSGTQQFHGLGFDYLRNSALDANAWQQNRVGQPKTTFQRNQVGGNIGGPIWKSKKLYFFFGYDGDREGVPATYQDSVPTALQRQGDFSQTFNPDGTLSVIYDPFSTRANPNGTGFIRDPFQGNKIPANRFDPVGAALIGVTPEGNQPGNRLTGGNNFYSSTKSITRNDRYDMRVDSAHSEKHTMYARMTKEYFQTAVANFFHSFADSGGVHGQTRSHNIGFGNTFVPTPTWVINILAGSSRNFNAQIVPGQGINGTKIGLPAATVAQFDANTFPKFTFDGYATVGNSRTQSPTTQTDNLQINVTKERGSHSIKFGFSAEAARLNFTDATSANFAFNRGMTSGPTASANSANSGNSIASLLLGTGASGNAPITTHNASLQMYYAWYLQDSWRISRRLTLNLGLRYEIQQARTERYNRNNNFDFTVANPLSSQVGLPLQGGLVFLSPKNRGLWDTDPNDFAPRIGLSFKVTDKMVVRTGYGISYPQTVGSGSTVGANVQGPNMASGGFATSTTWVTSRGGDNINPQDLLRNPFPQGITQPAGNSQGLLTLVGQPIDAFLRQHPSGYVQNYSFDIQYDVGHNTVIEVGYAGNLSRKLLFGAPRNADQLSPDLLRLGSALDVQVRNPFQGAITTGLLAGPTVPANQLMRPFPQYPAVYLSSDIPGASASYNALLAKVTRQFSHGLFLVSSYQWSKALDNASETNGWEITDVFRDYYNQKIEWSISAHDLPQSWVTSAVYELPVGKGKKFLAGMPAVANAVFGGWEVATTTRLNSGLPLQVTAANNLASYGFLVQRPNIANAKDLELSNRTPEQWFNTTPFKQPANYTIGNAPRFFSNLRFDWARAADVTLAKQFRVKERVQAQFRAEFFNITNTPQFGRANTNLASPAFGSVASGTVAQTGSTINAPRNIQLVLRLSF